MHFEKIGFQQRKMLLEPYFFYYQRESVGSDFLSNIDIFLKFWMPHALSDLRELQMPCFFQMERSTLLITCHWQPFPNPFIQGTIINGHILEAVHHISHGVQRCSNATPTVGDDALLTVGAR